MFGQILSLLSGPCLKKLKFCCYKLQHDRANNCFCFCYNAFRGVSRRTPGSPGFNVIFSSMVFPRVFLRKNYEKQVILAEKRCWASTLHISWLRPWHLFLYLKFQACCCFIAQGPSLCKTFFKLSSSETKIYPAHKC